MSLLCFSFIWCMDIIMCIICCGAWKLVILAYFYCFSDGCEPLGGVNLLSINIYGFPIITHKY